MVIRPSFWYQTLCSEIFFSWFSVVPFFFSNSCQYLFHLYLTVGLAASTGQNSINEGKKTKLRWSYYPAWVYDPAACVCGQLCWFLTTPILLSSAQCQARFPIFYLHVFYVSEMLALDLKDLTVSPFKEVWHKDRLKTVHFS